MLPLSPGCSLPGTRAHIAMNLIRSFLYRFPRFHTECPMDLIYGGSVVLGVCLNVSESGLRGTFANSVPAGTNGLLTLYPPNAGEQHFQVHVRIDSWRGDEARVRFCFQSEEERLRIRQFLKLAISSNSQTTSQPNST